MDSTLLSLDHEQSSTSLNGQDINFPSIVLKDHPQELRITLIMTDVSNPVHLTFMTQTEVCVFL